ncbi:UV excision repair protein Rad23 [Cryptosporidium meleagridis]|uniref:UV excision repair protein RAD23 n=1 Tax=Cryptosporidium meleagridis TaxID=93969 RepID=A0A2P4YXV5_9CRYT|nr:UV excision repair protein Rad23 [Cryptosporidium meleagridis]
MKIKIRTVQNTEMEVEVEADYSIEKVKQAIQELNPVMEASRLKLIFAGRILNDSQTVQDVGIKDGERLVVLLSKGASQKAAESQQSKQNNTSNESNTNTEPTASATTSNVQAQPGTSDPSIDSRASALLTGTELEETITNIVNMGFERDQVTRAMRAAFNNPDRAVEYLTSGLPIPENPVAPNPTNITPVNSNASLNAGLTTSEDLSSEQLPGNLESLRTNPLFQQLRSVVQQDPRILPELLVRIGQSNPEILQLITENQEEFIRMMERTDSDEVGEASQFPMQTTIQLTPQEAESVERLQALGFPRNAVIEAYLICEKNEELAANYLLENSADFFTDGAN